MAFALMGSNQSEHPTMAGRVAASPFLIFPVTECCIMKLTKKFWTWFSQVLALGIFLLRIDLVIDFIKLFPIADPSGLYPMIILLASIVMFWGAWLAWRAYVGFYRKMDFLFDEPVYRW